MAVKALKLSVIPAALGLASLRVYAVNKEKTQDLLSVKELSIYGPEAKPYRFVEENPGLLQSSIGTVRVGLTPYVRAVKDACISMKIGAVNLYYAGEDIYHYLKDPPPGFVPRISLITVSGLAGLVLARKGSRAKRLATSLGLATVSAAVCYPAPTITMMKLTGKRLYSAAQWSASTVALLWRPSPVRHAPDVPTTPETNSEFEVPPAKPTSDPEPFSLPENSVFSHTRGEGPSVDMAADTISPDLLDAEEDNTTVLAEQLAPPSMETLLPTDNVHAMDTPGAPQEKPLMIIDPKLMDHGQSNPEDADLYSTRS